VLREYDAELLVLGSSRPHSNQQFTGGGVEEFALKIEEKTGVPVEIVSLKPAMEE
jgi:hypothetical protein